MSRSDRLNSLLKEVLSDVVRRQVKNPHVHELVTVMRVDITKDLRHAKVFVSVIGGPREKKETLEALQSASGFIAINASKQVKMRYFPELTFKLDEGVDRQMRIEELLSEIREEQEHRPSNGCTG